MQGSAHPECKAHSAPDLSSRRLGQPKGLCAPRLVPDRATRRTGFFCVSADIFIALLTTVVPGGLVTKTVHDGLDRPIATYITDGSGGSDWDDATTVGVCVFSKRDNKTLDNRMQPIATYH